MESHSLESGGMHQLHVGVDLEEGSTTTLAVHVGDAVHYHVLEQDGPGGGRWGGGCKHDVIPTEMSSKSGGKRRGGGGGW